MAVASYAASVQGVALRVTRLDSQGYPLVGPENVYVTRAFMRVSFTPEYEEGDEITEKNAAGEVCVTYKSNDTLKRATMELAICDPDPELTELLTGGVLLKYDESGVPPVATGVTPPAFNYPNMTVGYASVKVGEAPNPNGVGVEVWSRAIKDGAQDGDLPFYRWVFPKATLRPSGDRVIENGLLANAFEGWSVGNIHFGTGPADDWYWPDATDRPFLYARDWTQPWDQANGWVEYTAESDTGAPEKDPVTGLPHSEYDITDVAYATGATAPVPYKYYFSENPDYGMTVPASTTPSGPSGATLGVGLSAGPTGPQGPASRRPGPDAAQGAGERPTVPSRAAQERAEREAATGTTGTTGTNGTNGTTGTNGSSE